VSSMQETYNLNNRFILDRKYWMYRRRYISNINSRHANCKRPTNYEGPMDIPFGNYRTGVVFVCIGCGGIRTGDW